MSTGFAANCPWHAGIAGLGGHRIVSTLAIGVADRMNWRKIDDIESHRLGVIHPRQTVTEGRGSVTVALCRTWEKFVPRAEHRSGAIDNDRGNRRILGSIGPVR